MDLILVRANYEKLAQSLRYTCSLVIVVKNSRRAHNIPCLIRSLVTSSKK
jgi:hypothetical protein